MLGCEAESETHQVLYLSRGRCIDFFDQHYQVWSPKLGAFLHNPRKDLIAALSQKELPKDCAKEVEVIGSFPRLTLAQAPLPSMSSDLLSFPECKDVTSDSVCLSEDSGPDLHSPTAGHMSPEASGVYDLI